MLPSASVLIGHEAEIVKPASIRPLVSASQAPVALWVNIRVMMPSGFSTRRISAKIAAMRCWYSRPASALAPFSPLYFAGLATASFSLSVSGRRNSSG